MPTLPINAWSKAFSSSRETEGTPSLGVGARDLRPEIANTPKVRKLQAQKTLEPVLNTALMLSPISALVQAASYAPEAEAAPNPLKMMQMFYHGTNAPLRRGIIEEVLDVSPQRKVAEYFAEKRAGQLGGEPQVYSILADPFVGKKHGLSIGIDEYNNAINGTQARKLSENDRPIQITTNTGLENFAKGGRVTTEDNQFIPNLMSRVRSGLSDYGSQVAERARSLRDQPIETLNAIGQDVIRQLQTPEGALNVAMNAPISPLAGLAGVIKQKGGNWLSGSVEGALKGLKKLEAPRYSHINEQGMAVGTEYGRPMTLEELKLSPEDIALFAKNKQLNQWIDKPLTRYVKNEMATPEDPIRALAERGVLHVDPDAQYWSNNFVHPSGEHLEKLATTPLAQRWENVTDNMLRVEPASTYQNFGSSNMTAEHPWIQNLAPDTPFYRPKDDTVPTNLGFNHLIDELSNAINPESGLPRELQFPAERLGKVSVPQAVERVDAINKWRAAMKAEADAAKANNAATVLHKEYPHSETMPNPKGLAWKELTHPEAATNEEARQALQDALKYEGDTMGHCVGGYCEDVIEGRSKIYSLRDAKGVPHVTVEVAPKEKRAFNLQRDYERLTPEERALADAYEGPLKYNYPDQAGIITPERLQELYDTSAPPSSIVQIKGKQNLIPNPEYLPFVQDFVKSGKWSDVGDLQNTGLYRKSTLTPEEQLGHLGEYLTLDEIKKLREGKPWTPIDETPELNFAQGGSVCPNKIETPEQLRAIIRDIQSRY